MPLKEYSHAWDIDALFEDLPCPCCGHGTWTEIRGRGFWCEQCNLHISEVSEPVGDQGYIVHFDDEHLWGGDAEQSLPDGATVTAKFLGIHDPELYWFTARDEETGDEIEWNPVAKPESA